jgi:hypothetical protein
MRGSPFDIISGNLQEFQAAIREFTDAVSGSARINGNRNLSASAADHLMN